MKGFEVGKRGKMKDQGYYWKIENMGLTHIFYCRVDFGRGDPYYLFTIMEPLVICHRLLWYMYKSSHYVVTSVLI